MMFLSCCTWALTGPDHEILDKLADVGFSWIDIQPHFLASDAARTRIGDLGLRVSCVGASFGMPEEAALDSADEAAAARALGHLEQALAHGAEVGATTAYVVPELDGGRAALDRYASSLVKAADRAAEHGLKLCIEHFPGRALPTVAATLDFLRAVGHPNLYLLFDIGHVQMSGEEPAAALANAGPLLGYVHLDDNDGRSDLHLALTDGILTEAALSQTFAALAAIDYTGAVSLELNPELPNPLEALKQSREIAITVGRDYLAGAA